MILPAAEKQALQISCVNLPSGTAALLAGLLGEPSATEVKSRINKVETIVTSVLTMVEAEWALIRAETRQIISAADAERLKGLLARSKAWWILMAISEDVRARASHFFPVESVKTMGAIHLATELTFMRVFPKRGLLSYDQRIFKKL